MNVTANAGHGLRAVNRVPAKAAPASSDVGVRFIIRHETEVAIAPRYLFAAPELERGKCLTMKHLKAVFYFGTTSRATLHEFRFGRIIYKVVAEIALVKEFVGERRTVADRRECSYRGRVNYQRMSFY